MSFLFKSKQYDRLLKTLCEKVNLKEIEYLSLNSRKYILILKGGMVMFEKLLKNGEIVDFDKSKIKSN